MQVLLFILTMLSPLTQAIDLSDYTGNWDYTVVAPDMTYKGVMALSEADGEYAGTMTSQGVEIALKDIEIEDDEITFNMNVQGFPCKVKGTFDGDNLKGVVMVEGFEMNLTATRAE